MIETGCTDIGFNTLATVNENVAEAESPELNPFLSVSVFEVEENEHVIPESMFY